MRLDGRRTLTFALVLGLVPALGACNRDAEVGDELDVPPASQTGPAQALRVTEVELGRSIDADGRVNDNASTDDFARNDTVYVSIATEGTGSGATLATRWLFQDGQVVDESSRTLSPTGASVTEFHISKPDGFPAGEYKVEILLNGQVVETKEFEIR